MKNFILGIAFIVLVGAATRNVIEVKPAKPFNTVIKEVYRVNKAQEMIQEYTKIGYIVKTISIGGSSGDVITILFEKY